MAQTSETFNHVVICGGGVIGCCVAFYLTKTAPELEVTIVERASVACGASGKAGGFLAKDWSSGPPAQLSGQSFTLHAQLAAELNGAINYGYRRVDTYTVNAMENSRMEGKFPVDWVRENVVKSWDLLGTTDTTAQLYPYEFTHAILKAAESRGAKLRIATVTGLKFEGTMPRRRLVGVELNGKEVLEADCVVIAMGPWSTKANFWFGQGALRLSLISQRAHSVILQPKPPVDFGNSCLFVDYNVGNEAKSPTDPEFYPRKNGKMYICGEADDSTPLPDDPRHVEQQSGACEMLIEIGRAVAPVLKDADVEVQQACYLPMSTRGLPIIGPVSGHTGAYVATGHSCWGILDAPITGLAVAELIAKGKTERVDLRFFRP